MSEIRMLEVNFEGTISHIETRSKPGAYANRIIEQHGLSGIRKTQRYIENPTLEVQECTRFNGKISKIIGTKVTYININN